MSSVPLLFAYGTLREPAVLAGVIGHGLEGIPMRPARAKGYRVVCYPGRTYPALIEAPESVAEGIVVGGLSAADLQLLDLFEGAEYERREIALTVEGEPVAAEYYWPVVPVGSDAAPWSFEDWLVRYRDALVLEAGETPATLRAQLIGMGGNGGEKPRSA